MCGLKTKPGLSVRLLTPCPEREAGKDEPIALDHRPWTIEQRPVQSTERRLPRAAARVYVWSQDSKTGLSVRLLTPCPREPEVRPSAARCGPRCGRGAPEPWLTGGRQPGCPGTAEADIINMRVAWSSAPAALAGAFSPEPASFLEGLAPPVALPEGGVSTVAEATECHGRW